MADQSRSEFEAVSFGKRVANSQTFTVLFKEGMALVEETASYLDGPGRRESKALDRNGALAYATESMRLTTRLMQIASWLLLHRAVNEGEMSLAQANTEKRKVKLSAGDQADAEILGMLPEDLRQLIGRSLGLQERVRRLDLAIHSEPGGGEGENPVERQLGVLRAAFERDR